MFVRETLPGGLRLVTENIPHLKSVSIGIIVGLGSQNESYEKRGLSHFLEHMTFKGTKKRRAKDIVAALDGIGGKINAYTSKEFTKYYIVVSDEHVGFAIELLGDIFLNSLFKKQDIETERNVILEEIKMYEDTPDELVHDLFSQVVWNKHRLGYGILGEKSTVEKINRSDFINYQDRYYNCKNTIIACAGKLSHDSISKKVQNVFKGLKESTFDEEKYLNPKTKHAEKIFYKDTEQSHVCLGGHGYSYGDPRRYSLSVLNMILGGAMSSRLFQNIREKEGLVYAIYSYHTFFKNTGLFTIYAGTSPKTYKRVVNLIVSEINKICEKGITKEELRIAKEKLKGNLVLGLETSQSRMSWIAKSEY